MPHLLACAAQWLTQPPGAIVRDEEENVVEFMVTAGLDRGDPFSPLALAANSLGEMQREILEKQPKGGEAKTACCSYRTN